MAGPGSEHPSSLSQPLSPSLNTSLNPPPSSASQNPGSGIDEHTCTNERADEPITQSSAHPHGSHNSSHSSSHASPQASPSPLGSGNSAHARKEYLDSLLPPSAEEFSRISDVQTSRAQETKRRSREYKRRERHERQSAEHSRPATSSSARSPSHQLPHRHHPHSEDVSSSSRPAIVEDILSTRAATLIQRTCE